MSGQRSITRAAVTVVAGSAAILGAVGGAVAQCTPRWSDNFATPGLSVGTMLTATEWNGRVYVGGEFSRLGNIPFSVPGTGAGSVAAWNGAGWERLGAGLGGARRAQAMIGHTAAGGDTLESGLYVGGLFTTAGGTPANNIARWTGTSWQPLGGGLASDFGPGSVYIGRMLVHDPDGSGPTRSLLWVFGDVQVADWQGPGQQSVSGVAVWNGTAWSPRGMFTITPPSGVTQTGVVYDAAVIDPDGPGAAGAEVWAGGAFDTVDGTPINGLARYDGSAWAAVPGLEGTVFRLGVVNEGGLPVVYAQGNLAINGGAVQDGVIARLRGGVWSQLPLQGSIAGVDGSDVLLNIIGDAAGVLARLGPASVTPSVIAPIPAGSGVSGESVVHAVRVDWDGAGPMGPRVLCLGGFGRLNSVVAEKIALVDGTSASPVLIGPGPGGLNSWTTAGVAGVDLDGPGPGRRELVIGGVTRAGTLPVRGGARFDGAAYQDLVMPPTLDPDGTPGRAAPVSFTSGVIGGVHGVYAAAGPAGVLRYTGSGFEVLAPVDGAVTVVRAFDDGTGTKLFAMGRFTSIAGQPLAGIAKFDGASWSDASAGFPGPIGEIAVYAAEVLNISAGGSGGSARLYLACGTTSPSRGYVLEWNGTGWTRIDNGAIGPTDFIPNALAAFNNRLYVGGVIFTVNGSPSRGLARYDGTAWSSIGSVAGLNAIVSGLGVHDDGSGPALYVSGIFTSIAGVPAVSLARFNGFTFSAVAGVTQALNAGRLVSIDEPDGPALYLAGDFVDFVDGKESVGLARLKTPCPRCRADFNSVGGLSVQDIFDYLSAYFAGDPRADFNGANGLSVQDIFDYLAAYFAGC